MATVVVGMAAAEVVAAEEANSRDGFPVLAR